VSLINHWKDFFIFSFSGTRLAVLYVTRWRGHRHLSHRNIPWKPPKATRTGNKLKIELTLVGAGAKAEAEAAKARTAAAEIFMVMLGTWNIRRWKRVDAVFGWGDATHVEVAAIEDTSPGWCPRSSWTHGSPYRRRIRGMNEISN